MSENEKEKLKNPPKEGCLLCAILCAIILAFCIWGLLGGFLSIAIFCLIMGLLIVFEKGRNKKSIQYKEESHISDLVKLRKLFEETEVTNAELKKQLTAANEEIEKLQIIKKTYQGIIDTEEEIKRLKVDANCEIEKQKADAKRDIALLEKNIIMLNKEEKEAKELLTAIRNSVEGYGSQYIKPSYTLLDELAEGFGHTEAGVQLKGARKKSILMVKEGRAVVCAYSSAEVSEKIKSLVLDAFDLRVDSILAQVRKDNYGILEQKIKDVFVIVNNKAKALYKDTYIRQEYLNARLGELKWGMIIYELKNQMQEEQRRIREKMKEEERARREYEKAVRESEKEEKILKAAMEKAKAQILEATEAQKKEYEDKLAELEVKLREAEEKGQRALSMAQQTKKGNVYVISNIGSFGENVYKIGMTRRLDPYERVRELGDASVPFPFDVHAIISSDDAPALELMLHKEFSLNQVNKVNPRKEFFRVPLKNIRETITKMGLDVSWTLMADATEYRETLVIEKKLDGDPVAQTKWVKYSDSLAVDRQA